MNVLVANVNRFEYFVWIHCDEDCCSNADKSDWA